ncbi:winged helix-turn-helix domain-containing protein [Labedaea rhizosphaerae]|uniref:Transcriptional regulator n=1 Tax=Labedaea rhizosphaerae TaxID=598644 RepID=A0A4R6SI85_LABRH|nr:response regulator transcription factor [Labedaea rhizosphaerae]TDQ00668.1 transcriptional regulator [Labedaea rhizosphaerae]
MAELFARLRAVLRRAPTPSAWAWADIEVDPITHAVSRGVDRAELSPTEFRMLARLIAPPVGVVRRRQLVDAAWPAGASVSDNTIDKYVSRLRRKLAEIGTEHTIRTARGVGYELV